MTTTFRPIGNKLLVKREEAMTVTAGGIHIPDDAQKKTAQGTVVAAGRGGEDQHGRFIETTVKPGNRVMFGEYAGTDIVIDGVKHLVMAETDVMGVIE